MLLLCAISFDILCLHFHCLQFLSFRYLCNLGLSIIIYSHCIITITYCLWPLFSLCLKSSRSSSVKLCSLSCDSLLSIKTVQMEYSPSLLVSVQISFGLFWSWNYSQYFWPLGLSLLLDSLSEVKPYRDVAGKRLPFTFGSMNTHCSDLFISIFLINELILQKKILKNPVAINLFSKKYIWLLTFGF